jgi:outer membrane protein
MVIARLLFRPRALSVMLAMGVASMAASPAWGDTPQPDNAAPAVRTMTLAEALAYARAHQPAVAQALARVALRERQAAVPTAQWLPKIAVGAQIFATTANNTTGTYAPFDGADGLDVPRIGGTPATATGTFSPYASTFVGVGANQELFDFGRIGAQRAAADALVTAERRSAQTARLDVEFGVEEAFFSVLAAKGVIRAADEAYARSLVHRDLAQRGVDAGLRSPIELTRAQADLARYDVGRVRARGGLQVAQTVLAAAVGAPDGALDAAEDPLRSADLPALPDAIALAEARNPWLARAIAELSAAEARARAVGAELRPDLSVTATLSGRAGGAPPATNAVPSGDGWIPAVPNWDAGLLFTWPLFDGVVIARRDAAASEEQVRKSEIDVTRLQVVAAVREAYERVGVARATVVALQNAAVTARANWEQADARFRAGIGNAVEAADAEAVRATAEIDLALGQFELERIRAAFGRAIAEGL